MSIEIGDVSAGVLTVQISGTLTQPELAGAQRRLPELLARHGAFRLLIITESFQGWGGGNWSNSVTQTKNDDLIRRIAIVGDRKWEDLVVMFLGKGLRRAEVEYFEPSALPQARAWLAAT